MSIQGTQLDSARVQVYSEFDVVADSTTAHVGSSVRFTSRLDQQPFPAARWVWRGKDTVEVTSCAGQKDCVYQMDGAGTPAMWAYLEPEGVLGDSASRVVLVHPRRKLQLSPNDSIYADRGASVSFAVTAEGDATLRNITWSPSAPGALVALRLPSGFALNASITIVSTTCEDGVPSCSDVVAGSYTRSVTAIVDDSTQTDSATVIVVGDVGEEDGIPCAADPEAEEIVSAIRSAAFLVDLVPTAQRRPSGPFTTGDSLSMEGSIKSSVPCLSMDDCWREVTIEESNQIIAAAKASPEWRYTQGGFQGGEEPAKNLGQKFGDCTDFTWYSSKQGLGALWPFKFGPRPGTSNFRNWSDADLRMQGYARVSQQDPR